MIFDLTSHERLLLEYHRSRLGCVDPGTFKIVGSNTEEAYRILQYPSCFESVGIHVAPLSYEDNVNTGFMKAESMKTQ